MNKIIDFAAEYHCFEDFDYRKSRQKSIFTASGITLVQKYSLHLLRTMTSSSGQPGTYILQRKTVLSI